MLLDVNKSAVVIGVSFAVFVCLGLFLRSVMSDSLAPIIAGVVAALVGFGLKAVL